jgi:hypothetical protein
MRMTQGPLVAIRLCHEALRSCAAKIVAALAAASWEQPETVHAATELVRTYLGAVVTHGKQEVRRCCFLFFFGWGETWGLVVTLAQDWEMFPALEAMTPGLCAPFYAEHAEVDNECDALRAAAAAVPLRVNDVATLQRLRDEWELHWKAAEAHMQAEELRLEPYFAMYLQRAEQTALLARCFRHTIGENLRQLLRFVLTHLEPTQREAFVQRVWTSLPDRAAEFSHAVEASVPHEMWEPLRTKYTLMLVPPTGSGSPAAAQATLKRLGSIGASTP